VARAVSHRHPPRVLGAARPLVGKGTGPLDPRHAQRVIPLSAIFEGDLKRATLAGSTLAFVAVFGLWGSTNWARPWCMNYQSSAELNRSPSLRP
jgi:hypothetical protein